MLCEPADDGAGTVDHLPSQIEVGTPTDAAEPRFATGRVGWSPNGDGPEGGVHPIT